MVAPPGGQRQVLLVQRLAVVARGDRHTLLAVQRDALALVQERVQRGGVVRLEVELGLPLTPRSTLSDLPFQLLTDDSDDADGTGGSPFQGEAEARRAKQRTVCALTAVWLMWVVGVMRAFWLARPPVWLM